MKRLPLILILGAAACAHPNAAAQKFAPLCPDGVKVFNAPSEVGEAFEEVGWLHARGESGYNDETVILQSQRTEAAQRGANGLIVGGFQELDAVLKAGGVGKTTIAEVTVPERGAVLAIYIPGDSSRVKASCK